MINRDDYILLKDLPDIDAGARFCWDGKDGYYMSDRVGKKGSKIKFMADFVNEYTEWFVKEAKPPEVIHIIEKQSLIDDAKELLEGYGYKVQPIPGDKRNGYFWSEYNKDAVYSKEMRSEKLRNLNWNEQEQKLTEIKESESVEEKAFTKENIIKRKVDLFEKSFSIQDMEECFAQAREMETKNTFLGRMRGLKFESFQSYMNIKNEQQPKT